MGLAMVIVGVIILVTAFIMTVKEMICPRQVRRCIPMHSAPNRLIVPGGLLDR